MLLGWLSVTLRRHAHRMVMVAMMVERSHYRLILGQLALLRQLLSASLLRQNLRSLQIIAQAPSALYGT